MQHKPEIRYLLREALSCIGNLPDGPADQLRHASLKAALCSALETPTHVLTDAARDVLAERRRQVDVEGFTPVSDDRYNDGVLSAAAGSYALHAFDRRIDTTPARWPWTRAWWKPGTPRQMLVKAGALILAAIDQIDRRTAK